MRPDELWQHGGRNEHTAAERTPGSTGGATSGADADDVLRIAGEVGKG